MKLLIQALYDCSTNNYERYFPFPMNLMKISQNGDDLIDLNLMAFGKNVVGKRNLIDLGADLINSRASEYEEIIINCGEYAPDGAFNKHYDQFLKKIKVPVSVMGSYPAVFRDRIKSLYGDRVKIIDFDFDVHDVILNDEMIETYPKVGGKAKGERLKKVNLKLTTGCPRSCSMCPVSLIHKGKHVFYNIEISIKLIKQYYEKGVRFFNFIDDNIAVNPKFIEFMRLLKKEDLKDGRFQVQEGFEVIAFLNEEFCQLLIDNHFEDIKIGIENTKEVFRKSINKTFFTSQQIETALQNINKYNLDVKQFLLISTEQSQEDILDNIKFAINNELSLRVNIIREYEKSNYFAHEKKSLITDKELTMLKSFASAVSWLMSDKKINAFKESAFEEIKVKSTLTIYQDETQIKVSGSCYHGFKTSLFVTALKYILEQEFKVQLSVSEHDKENITYNIIRTEVLPKVA